jgi:hypothetical protein
MPGKTSSIADGAAGHSHIEHSIDSAVSCALARLQNSALQFSRATCLCEVDVVVMCRNARFCLICNYVNKIIPALQSRCTRFRFPPLPEQFVKARLSEIAAEESITVRHIVTRHVSVPGPVPVPCVTV